jgi:hypothetical protein
MADTIITDEEGDEGFLVNCLTLIKAFYLEQYKLSTTLIWALVAIILQRSLV